jgi:hypothetical protein
MRLTTGYEKTGIPIPAAALSNAAIKTNSYLARVPELFNTSGSGFYGMLNQRNLSGFVGEILKHAIHSEDQRFLPNPHPDGRPDLLNLSDQNTDSYFRAHCLNAKDGSPIRQHLAPFRYGGIEIKCCIGTMKKAGEAKIGVPRVEQVTGLSYWAHHAHDCHLLAIYYDFCSKTAGSPQIRSAFFADIQVADWYKVSIGNPTKKKTSNTSLKVSGINKLRQNPVLYYDDAATVRLLHRLGVVL